MDVFSSLIETNENRVLYFGDHIFGDIIQSKKSIGWRTCLIVPEIEHEIQVLKVKERLLTKMERLEYQLEMAFKNTSSNVDNIKKQLEVRLYYE